LFFRQEHEINNSNQVNLMSSGITNIQNMAPELPLQFSEDLLSTPMFNLIHSFGADLHYAESHIGKNIRMSRYERLSTAGGQLDGSGIDPAPEVVVRTDIDARVEIYAKTVVVNEQVRICTACFKPLLNILEGLKAAFAVHGNQRQALIA
jgi:hypothetical protein